jgi:hypothetical protein
MSSPCAIVSRPVLPEMAQFMHLEREIVLVPLAGPRRAYVDWKAFQVIAGLLEP